MRTMGVITLILVFSAPGVEAVDRFVNPLATCPLGRLPQHTTIQGAVDEANPGDVIGVCPGTYEESVVVPATKPRISLTGLGRVILVFRDFPTPPPLRVLADDVRIEGLDVRGSDMEAVTVAANRATIQRNRITGGDTGLTISGDGHRIRNNVISGGTFGLGLLSVNGAVVSGNRVTSGGFGIFSSDVTDRGSAGIVIEHNIVVQALVTGIFLVDSEGATIRNNIVRESDSGIFVLRTVGVDIVRNLVQKGSLGILVAESTGCVVGLNSVGFNVFRGIDLHDIDGCTIRRNNVSRNGSPDCAWDGSGANTFEANVCATEVPRGAWD